MYIIEFSKNLLTLLPDFEALSGSNYILKHKTLPILLYPSVSPTPNWEPPLNVNIANTQKHVKRLLFKLSELPMLEEFKGDNGGYVYTRKIDFLSPEAVDVSLAGFSDSLFGIAERVRALNGIINIYNLWYNNKMNEEKILQEQLEKTQNALAEKNTKRVERYKSRAVVFNKLKLHFESMGVTVDSVNEGEFINVTLKNGTKAKVVATDSGAYLEEIVVPETYEQTSMSILFKKLDSLAAM